MKVVPIKSSSAARDLPGVLGVGGKAVYRLGFLVFSVMRKFEANIGCSKSMILLVSCERISTK